MGKVLLTGANGFVAMHITLLALKRGHHVVGTVRSQKKAEQTLSLIPEDLRSRISFAIVEDAGVPDAFDDVVKVNDFDGVIHTATPFHYNITDPHELLDPAVEGTKNILEAAYKYGPNIKKMVITSSCAAVLHEDKGTWPGKVYTEDDWNPITWEETQDGNKSHAYYGAKTWAEKTAWKFVEDKHPSFEVITICPPFIFGPAIQHVESLDSLNTSNAYLYNFINGSLKGKDIPANNVPLFVDVRNVAEAHVFSYEKPNLGNQRILAISGNQTNKEIADIFRKNFPDRADNVPSKLPPGHTADGVPEGGIYTSDNSKSRRLLGIEYLPLERSIVDLMASLKDLETRA